MRGLMKAGMMIVLMLGCGSPPQPPPTFDPSIERAEVERTLTAWFETGLARADTAEIGRYLTSEFQILEDTDWFGRDEFLEFILSLPEVVGGPFTIQYTLSDWRTRVSGDVAWTSLRNHAEVTPENGDPFALDWLENAVLKKEEGNWLIDRYHSATMR